MEIYRVSKWHDKNNYECLFCRYATLSEAAIWQHWQMKHAPPPPPASPILIADAAGREVRSAVESGEYAKDDMEVSDEPETQDVPERADRSGGRAVRRGHRAGDAV